MNGNTSLEPNSLAFGQLSIKEQDSQSLDKSNDNVQVADEAMNSPCQDGPLEMLMDALFGLIIDVPVTLVCFTANFHILVRLG